MKMNDPIRQICQIQMVYSITVTASECYKFSAAQAARGKVVAEIVQHLAFASGIGKGQVRHADARHTVQADRRTPLLHGDGGKLGQTFRRGDGTDERGYLPAEVDHRALYLRDQLQEGGHHAESHRAVAQAVHPPQEGRGVAGREADLHHRAGERRIVSAPHDLITQAGLQKEQPADGSGREFQRADQYAVLQVFLHVALYATLGRADTAGERPHPAHIGLAEQQGRRHDEHDGAGQTRVHVREEPERPGQLHRQYRDGGNAPAQRVGDGGRVLDHPVEDVARMQCLAPGQVAFHLPFKEGAVQSVAETDFRTAAQLRAGHRQQWPYRKACHQQRDKQVHVAVATACGRVDETFRHPH